jgi:hypothetical protein
LPLTELTRPIRGHKLDMVGVADISRWADFYFSLRIEKMGGARIEILRNHGPGSALRGAP